LLSSNTSYHPSIATTPFELLFGDTPTLPSFPNPDIQRLHYGESTAAERYQLLQKIRFVARNVASDQGAKITVNFDRSAFPHNFNLNDLVWYEDFASLGKNPKLTPKWQGPAKITEINDTNARILLSNGKSKVLNVMRLKMFFSAPDENNSDESNVHDTLDFTSAPKHAGPVTRAMKKLKDHKNAAQLAINVLCDLSKKHCAIANGNKNVQTIHCYLTQCLHIKECQSWLINKQSVCAKCKLQLGQHIVDNQAQNDAPVSNSIHQQCHHFNQKCESSENSISGIKFKRIN